MNAPIQKLLSLKLGQLLLIETSRELLTGTLTNIDTKHLMIELENVRDIRTNYTYQSSQMLTYPQMKKINVIEQENDTLQKSDSPETDSDDLLIKLNSLKTTSSTNSSNSSINNLSAPDKQHSNSSKEQCDSLSIELTSLDLQMLQTQLDTMIFIKQTDQKYHKALNDIKTQTAIGILMEPIHAGRNRKTSLLAVSTPKNIYIFDILSLGQIFKEFRLILESERPRKVIHYSHKIVDHLKSRHNIELAGIFDTFVSYCVVTGQKTNISLEEIIQKLFNISNIYFEPEIIDSKLSFDPYQRPISQEQLMITAKKVAFQLKLYDHLLHEQMLKNFYQQCYKFAHTFANNDDNFEVAQQLHPRSLAGYQHILPNGNWKDKLETDLDFLNNQQDEL